MRMFALYLLTAILVDSWLGSFACAAEKATEQNQKFCMGWFGFYTRQHVVLSSH